MRSIVFSPTREAPTISTFTDEGLKDLSVKPLSPYFFELLTDKEIKSVIYTPVLGPSREIIPVIRENQAFVLYDLLKENEIMPFQSFLDFFNEYLPSLGIDFEKSKNPLQAIIDFVSIFDKKYLLWSLTYIAHQPWYNLYVFNKEFSDFLLEKILIIIDILESKPKKFDVSKYPYDYYNKERPLHLTNADYSSISMHVDSLYCVIQSQLGAGFAYILSAELDIDRDFPLTSYVPPFSGNVLALRREDSESLLMKMPKDIRTLLLALCVFDGDSSFSLSDFAKDMKTDPSIVASILEYRMLFSEKPHKSSIDKFVREYPNSIEVIEQFASNNAAIPLEWIPVFTEVISFGDASESIIFNSIRSAVPLHIASQYSQTTVFGALVANNAQIDQSSVLLPGSIIMQNAKVNANTLIMQRSVVSAGAELPEANYVPPACVFGSTEDSRKGKLGRSVGVNRGVVFGANSSIGSHANIGAGADIGENAIISNGASVGAGSIIEKDEIVPARVVVPAGLKFSKSLIERNSNLPHLIIRRGIKFMRRQSGIVSLSNYQEISKIPGGEIFVRSYIYRMADFPSALGHELANFPSVAISSEDLSLLGFSVIDAALSYISNGGPDGPVKAALMTAAESATKELHVEDSPLSDNTVNSLLRVLESGENFNGFNELRERIRAVFEELIISYRLAGGASNAFIEKISKLLN